jgi:hypothetical protein
MKAFLEFGLAERHFNTIESSYRALASTWLLAVFAGVGYVLSARPTAVPLDPLVVAAAICLVGTVGILMLWYIDTFVYHRLLDDWFEEGLRLEARNPWLPQVRTRMLRNTGDRGVVPRVAIFYAGATTMLILTCGALLSAWVATVAVSLPWSGGRREFHPPAPTEPGVTVSRHRALVILLTRRT